MQQIIAGSVDICVCMCMYAERRICVRCNTVFSHSLQDGVHMQLHVYSTPYMYMYMYLYCMCMVHPTYMYYMCVCTITQIYVYLCTVNILL